MMSTVIGGAMLPHAPQFFTMPETEDKANVERVREVAPGLHFAGSLEVLRRVAERPPEATRLLLGYAGWGPGQLESELAEGAWLLAPAEGHVVFDVPYDEMWAYVVRRLGVEPATLVASRGVH